MNTTTSTQPIITPAIYTRPIPAHTHLPRKSNISFPLRGCGIRGARQFRKFKKMSGH